jgi:hypothetical protein
MEENGDEPGRRIVSVVHLAMLAAVAIYAIVLLLARGNAAVPAGPPRSANFVILLFAIGAAQWGAATIVGKTLLRWGGPGAGAAERVRRFFLVRFAAAEAIAVFGLIAGLTGGPRRGAVLLLCTSAFALLASSPSRTAYRRAFEQTRAGRR